MTMLLTEPRYLSPTAPSATLQRWLPIPIRPNGGDGINLFIVEKGAPGFSVSGKLDKVGNKSIETGELVFEGCRVPAKNMIGERAGAGFDMIADTLISGGITYGGPCTGAAQLPYD